MIIANKDTGRVMCEVDNLDNLLEALEAEGWTYNDDLYMLTKIEKKEVEGVNGTYTQTDRINVGVQRLAIVKEMHYSEYKNKYSDCMTKKDSYNKETKTIVVYIGQEHWDEIA